MTKEELLEYELPSYTEYISIGWMQTIIARLVAHKVKRKIKRFNERQKRKRFVKNYFNR